MYLQYLLEKLSIGGNKPVENTIYKYVTTINREEIMFFKRKFLSGVILAGAMALTSTAATADEYIGGWQKDHPVIKYGVIPVETQTQTTSSMDAFLKHAEKETGVKWKLYQASNYSGVMNAMIADQIDLAWLSG